MNGFNLGKIFGVQVRLHYSWFLIFLFVTIMLGWQVFPLYYPGWNYLLYWGVSIATSLLFFASVLAHELAHSLVGRASGVIIKSITLFIFGGIARMSREVTKAGAEFKMAAAGPACSLIIGGLFYLLSMVTQNTIGPLAAMASYLAGVNIILAVFNMIPGFPLDGGRVFRSILWRITGNYGRSTRIAAWVGRGIAYAFILGGIIVVFLQPWGLSWLNGLWLAFLGWFLENAAATSYRQVQWREALQGLTAAQIMTTSYAIVSPNITVDQLVQEYILTKTHHLFLVIEEDRFKGIVTLQNIKSVPRSKWSLTQLEKIMIPAERLRVASPDQNALRVAEQLGENEANPIPVLSEGRVIGLVTEENLLRLLRTRAELGIKDTPSGRQG